MEYILKEMKELNAEGVDFISVGDNSLFPKVYASYTKRELEIGRPVPRAGRKYWKMVDGKKTYIE